MQIDYPEAVLRFFQFFNIFSYSFIPNFYNGKDYNMYSVEGF